jgi:flagellar biosynthesis anti-sigma factor FlgM
MKIPSPDSHATSGLNQLAGAAPSGTGSASKQAAKPEAASDRVQLSNLSNYLASALEGSPSHVAKVGQLAGAVSSGEYRVNAHAVSGSIIQHSIEFGGANFLALNS